MAPHLAESTDDVAFRLQLLVKNNYYLPPAHAKPNLSTTSLDIGRSDDPSGRKRSLGALFKKSRGRGPPKTPSLPEFRTTDTGQTPAGEDKRKHVPLPLDLQPPIKPFASPSSLPPSPRIVVLREPLPDIDAALKASEAREEARRQLLPSISTPKASIGTMHGSNYFDLDPTSAVDLDPSLTHQVSNLSANAMGGAIPPEDLSELFNNSGSTGEDETWRRALLQSAVGLSLSDMSGSVNGKRARGWHSAEQSTSSEWPPSSGSRARSASAAGLPRQLTPSRLVSSSASSIRSAMTMPRSPLSVELPPRPSSAVPAIISNPATPRKSSSGRRSIEARGAEEDIDIDAKSMRSNQLRVPRLVEDRPPSRASVASSRGRSLGGESPTIPAFNGLPIGPQTGSCATSISGSSSRYATAYSNQPLTPSVYLRHGAYGSTPSLHSFVNRHTPSPTPPASLRDHGRASPRNPSPRRTPPPPPRESFSLPVPELTPAPRRRHKQGRRSTPAEEKVLPWTKTLPLAEFSPSLQTAGEDPQASAALKQWGSTSAFKQGISSVPSAESVSSASVYSEEGSHRRRSQVESSIWQPQEGDASFSALDDNTPPSLRVAPPEGSMQSRYSMDTFGGGHGKHSGGGSISFLSFDEQSGSGHHDPNEPVRNPPSLSSTFGDGEDRASTIAGGSSYLDLHHTEDERVDIPTPVAFFDAVEAQHRAKSYDPNMDNESASDYEPSEAGTEDIEVALREGTIRPADVGLPQLHLATGPPSTPRATNSKPEAEINAPSLSESLPPPEEQSTVEPTSEPSVPSREDDSPEGTPTLPYLSLDPTKPITNVSTPKRTFFNKEGKSRRDQSLLPGTSDNIKIKGEVIPQETFERLKYASLDRSSTSAISVISGSTVMKPRSKASTTPSVYSRGSSNRSATKLIDEDSSSLNNPSPSDMRDLDGMVAMHLEAEKERIKRITKGVKEGAS
jgi:hypothetical protein